MHVVTVRKILQTTKGKLIRGDTARSVGGISIDSRSIKYGDLFIAIKGERFNGHQFVKEAVRAGALGIIVEAKWPLDALISIQDLPQVVIQVEDTLNAFTEIAGMRRRQFLCPFIAVTGSVGKTTTKNVITTVLRQKISVGATSGTQNNHLGVPLTLLGLKPEIKAAVIELGMNHEGEIAHLAALSKPDVGIITNIGPSHLEFFESVDNIARAKMELLEAIDSDGLVILNRDCAYYDELVRNTNARVISVGKHVQADFQAVDISIGQNGNVHFVIAAKPYDQVLEVCLPVIGIHYIYSALIAAAVGFGMGLNGKQIVAGLEKITAVHMRLELKEIAGIKIIDDCYNANPISVAGALDTIAGFKDSGKKIFVCGDMFELGKDSVLFHRQIGEKVVLSGVDRLITVGELSKHIRDAAVSCGMDSKMVNHCKNNIEAVEVLGEFIAPGDVVLIKGSRANHMEEILKGLEEYYEALESLIA